MFTSVPLGGVTLLCNHSCWRNAEGAVVLCWALQQDGVGGGAIGWDGAAFMASGVWRGTHPCKGL